MRIAVLGATSNLGLSVVSRLLGVLPQGERLIAHGVDAARLAALECGRVECRLADVNDGKTFREALDGATHIVNCLRLTQAHAVLHSLPARIRRIVMFGSTRVYSHYPGEYERGLRAGKALLERSGLPFVLLEPTMIYGGPREANIRRLLNLVRQTPVLPLPNRGRALVQPVFVGDVARAAEAALSAEGCEGRSIVVAGPEPLSYASLVAACGAFARRRVLVLPMPVAIMRLAAAVTRILPGVPAVDDAVVLRTTEDRAFDIAALRTILGIEPLPLAQGLAAAYGQDAAKA